MNFKKKDFIKKYKNSENEEPIEELHNLDGQGHNTASNGTNEIRTNTMKSNDDTSTYDKDVEQSSEDMISKTRNTKQFYDGYSMGSPGGSIKEALRGVSERIVTKSESNDILKDRNINDLDNNRVLDIEEIDNPALISKVKSMVNSINSSDVNDENLLTIINYIIGETKFNEINTNLKNIIKRNL